MDNSPKTTHWSIVIAAGGKGDGARAALSTLCETYQPAIVAYVRSHMVFAEEAEDLAQDFLVHLLASNLPGRADPSRGKFRAFLFTSLRNFLANHHERNQTLRRGGQACQVPEQVLDGIEAAGADPQQAFETEWARTVLRKAFASLREESERAGRGDLFAQLSPFLIDSPADDDYEALARANAMRRNTIAVAVHRLRARLRDVVRDVLADTTGSDAEIDEELRHFREVLSDSVS